MKKDLRYLLAFVAVLFVFSSCKNKQQQPQGPRPNIIFILSDDHAYQAISAYGDSLNHTPNIDALAKEGMLFNRAFVNNSLFITGISRSE